MEYTYYRKYMGPIKLVILDWADYIKASQSVGE
jgi:hypothetical protein